MSDHDWRCLAHRSHGICNTLNGPDDPTCGACGHERDRVTRRVSPTLLKIRDGDDGADEMSVVRLPEGFSFQIPTDAYSCASVIVSPEDAEWLRAYLAEGHDAHSPEDRSRG